MEYDINYVKHHPDAKVPTYSTEGSGGADMTAVSVKYLEDLDVIEYDTGIAMEIPFGYSGFLLPRSSISKYKLILTNCVGLSDSDYRGTIKARFRYIDKSENSGIFIKDHIKHMVYYKIPSYEIYNIGDKIIQFVLVKTPQANFIERNELSTTDRNNGGFGSTGK